MEEATGMKTGNDVSANIQCKIKVCFEFLWKFYSGRCLVEQMTLVKYSLIFGGVDGSVHWNWAQNVIYYKKPKRIVLLAQS